MTVRRRWRGRRLVGLVLLDGVAIVLFVVAGPRSASSVSAASTHWSVTVTPSTVVDGQSVKINVKAFAGFSVGYMQTRMCGGVPKLSSGVPANGLAPPKDFSAACSHNPVSSSATGDAIDTHPSIDNATTADGETFLYRVGSGTVQYFDGDGLQHTLTCDENNACSLGIELLIVPQGQPAQWENFVQPLTFGSNDPIAGCGGPADGVLATGGSDRMTEDWINWSLAECVLPGRKGAATRSSFVGEGAAVASFAAGGLDIAYSASGYDPAVSLFDPSQISGTPRPEVNIPVALNAAVVGVIANQTVNGHLVPVSNVKLTLPEIAGILNGGTFGEPAYDDAIRARNPQLGSVFGPAYGTTALAYPGADSNTWYLTRMLTELAPKDWSVPVPSGNIQDPNAGRARGTTSSFAAADPSFASKVGSYLTLANGRASVVKVVSNPAANAVGDFWMVTDLESANVLGLTPVAIEMTPGSGNFVPPNPTNMTAALSAMVPDSRGVLIGADPKSAAATGAASSASAAAYPLTYVEYATVPAQPLLNDDCTPRTTSQALLTTWLKYITGPGQGELATGMLPLTASLASAAAKAIATVGTAPISAQSPAVTPSGQTCTAIASGSATTATTTTSTTAPAGPKATSPQTTPSTRSVPDAGTAPSASSPPNGPPASIGSPTPAATTPPTTAVTQIALPAFAGTVPLGYGGAVLALVGLIALSALAAVTRTDPGRAAWRRLALRPLVRRARPRRPDSS